MRRVDELLNRLGATARWGDSITALEDLVERSGSAVERALKLAAGKANVDADSRMGHSRAGLGLLQTAVDVCEALAVCLEDSKILARVHAVRDLLLVGKAQGGGGGSGSLEQVLSSLLSLARAGAVGSIGGRSRMSGGEHRR